MSDRLLRLAEGLLRLEDSLLRLEDRLVDNPIIELSASLYFVYIQRVMPKLEDMADFLRTNNYFETTIQCPVLRLPTRSK